MPYTPPTSSNDTSQSQGWYQVNETSRDAFTPVVAVPQSKSPLFILAPEDDDSDTEAEAAIESISPRFDINSEPQSIRLPPANAKPLKPSLKSHKDGDLSTLVLYTGHPLLIPFRDPLEILPTELWISCIQLALGDSSVHGPLLYAGVSTNWQATLLETPILWKEICLVNGEDEDARVAAFLQLSQQTPLTVEILAPIHDLTPLSRMLEHTPRIESLSFNPYYQLSDSQKFVLDAAWSTSLHSMLSLIMRPGIRYDMLKYVDGAGILTISQAMTIIWTCPNARFVSSREGSNKGLPIVPTPFNNKIDLEHVMVQILSNTSSHKRNILLVGSPNSGKTSMAAYFMQRYRNLFSFILFVDASSERSIQAGLISAAEQLGLPAASKWDEVLHSLTQQENLLVVYDNVLGPKLLERYLPPCGHSAILATSKYLSKEEKLGYPRFSIVQVGPKSVQFAAELEDVILFENTEHQDAASGRIEGDEEGYYQRGNKFNRFSEDKDRVLFDIDVDKSSIVPIREPSPFANVHVETLAVTQTRHPILCGSILVKNIAFEKTVALRFTLDYWQTTSEMVCKYVCTLPTLPLPFPREDSIPGVSTPTWDRFSFQVRLEDVEWNLEERTLFFAARYNVPGIGEWWDDNDAGNYKVFFKRSKLPSDDNSTITNETPKRPSPLLRWKGRNPQRMIPALDLETMTLSSILDYSLPPLKLKL